MAEENEEKEGKVEIDGVPGRMLMGIDKSGNKRILRCDEDGYLFTKAIHIIAAQIEEGEEGYLIDSSRRLIPSPAVEGEWKLAAIAKDGTISNAVDLGGNFAYLQVVIPTIDSAQLELQVSERIDGTYQDLGQDALTNAQAVAWSDTWQLGGWQFIKIKASAAQTTSAVNFNVRGITY